MKIGGVELHPLMGVYLGLIVFASAIVMRMYVGGKVRREEGRRTVAIRSALRQGGVEAWKDGAAQCRALLKVQPRHTAARLHLAAFLYRLGEYKEAEEEYAKVAKAKSVPKPLRATALVGRGAALFAAAGGEKATFKKRKKVLALAEKLFRRARETDPASGDAAATLGLALSWKGEEAADKEALRLFDLVLDKSGPEEGGRPAELRPPGLPVLKQVYEARGVVLLRLGRPQEAAKAFACAAAVAKDWAAPKENRRRARLAAVVAPDTPFDARLRLLKKIERTNITRFSKEERTKIRLTLGIGYRLTKRYIRPQEYMEKGFVKARANFQRAINLSPNNHAGYENMAALLGDAEEYQWSKLPQRVFHRFQTSADKTSAGEKVKPKGEERQTMSELTRLLDEHQRVIRMQLQRTEPSREDNLRLRLEELRLTRLAALLQPTRTARLNLLKEAKMKAKELYTLYPDEAKAAVVYALLSAETGRWAEAAPLLRRNLAALPANFEKIVRRLNAAPRLFDVFPPPGSLVRGGATVVSVSVDPHGGAFLPRAEGLSATFDGRPVAGTVFSGTQLCFVPSALSLSHGKHRVEFRLRDVFGREQRAETSLRVDKKGPTIAVTPPPSEPLKAGRPVWTIHLSDPDSGVLLSGVNVLLKTDREADPKSMQIIEKRLVENGRYRLDAPKEGLKRNAPLSGSTFRVTVRRSLRRGAFALSIRCTDRLGNQATYRRTWTVK